MSMSLSEHQRLSAGQEPPLFDLNVLIVKHIDVSRFPIPMALTATFDRTVRLWLIECEMYVVERDGNKRIRVLNQIVIAEDTLFQRVEDARGRVVDLIHRMMRSCVSHEFDECFLVDGIRVRDPHRNEKPRT